MRLFCSRAGVLLRAPGRILFPSREGQKTPSWAKCCIFFPPNDQIQSSLSDPRTVARLHSLSPMSTVSFPSVHRAHLAYTCLIPSGCHSCLQTNTPTIKSQHPVFNEDFLPTYTFHIFSHTHLATPLLFSRCWISIILCLLWLSRIFFQLQNA